MSKTNPKVAIVHDWLYGGGAELVVEQLHKMYPDAPIYTSYCSDEWRTRLDNKVVTGFLQYWPFNKIRKFVPFLRIWWFTRLKFDQYDIVISSSGAEAKGIKTSPKTLHVNYCHAPTHYYWSRYDEYIAHPGFGAFDWLARFGLKLLLGSMRRWDYKAAQRPDIVIANSMHIAEQIQKYYNRSSTIVFPPVDAQRFKPTSKVVKNNAFIIAGRQTPYKRFDLAITACTQANIPLRVIGDGPDNARLRSLAGPSISFLGRLNDQALEHEFQSARALIFPGLDDFGITPVEAIAAGTPVIAYKAGGALDYITPKTGIFFESQHVDALVDALQSFKDTQFTNKNISNEVEAFSVTKFRQNIQKIITTSYKNK